MGEDPRRAENHRSTLVSVGAIIYLSTIAFVIALIFTLYCISCSAHGMVDGWWRRKLDPLPSTDIGMFFYNRSYNKQIKEQDEQRENLEEYHRLKREGKLL